MNSITKILGWGAAAIAGAFVVLLIGENIYFDYFYDEDRVEAAAPNNTTAQSPSISPERNADNLIMRDGGISLYSAERADKWLLTFSEPIFGNWIFGRPKMKSSSGGVTEVVGYGPRQQGEMYFHSAVAYDQLLKLKAAYNSKQRGTRAHEAAYQELRDFEKSEFRLGDIYDNDTQEYVDYKWAAYKFTADELLRRHSRNVVRDWVCYYNKSYPEDLGSDFRPGFECHAFVSVQDCQAPLARWNSEEDWRQLECAKRDYVPIGGDFYIFQSSHTRHHQKDQWANGKLYNGDIVVFSGLMHCLDIDYKKCHVRATDIRVIPNE